MKVTNIIHKDVNRKGVIGPKGGGRGAVRTQRAINVQRGYGCNCGTCRHDHDYITINHGRNFLTKEVRVQLVEFENTEKLNEFLKGKTPEELFYFFPKDTVV